MTPQEEIDEFLKETPIDIRIHIEVQYFLLEQKRKNIDVPDDVMEMLGNIFKEIKQWKEDKCPVSQKP